MNVRRIAFAVLMVTVFLIPFLLGMAAALIATACLIGWSLAQDFIDWLAGPLGKS